ncbi:MAG: DUF433 domain-containing protein [Oscillatoriales cyanobacterium RU_3_3]|nr:DUF433 domain-containing protein [Microcoleus sp. SU_5_6]NJL65719.1 DUF433 domain-containing protein [Microcoleus sp. SM1_3_4]NJM61204.1 DUF433 domain-containing protein [Oscillatoriales cyanobacterium RU_3_3]NJR23437.1 DUF433 domain-containing protein [Richelia sp. CSU_2_1]
MTATVVDIGTLITRDRNLRSGRPIIAGTATSVRRIAVLYKQGNNAEEIARLMTHLSIAQVYAALTYYHANRAEIDTDLAEEQAAYEQLAELHYKNLNTKT